MMHRSDANNRGDASTGRVTWGVKADRYTMPPKMRESTSRRSDRAIEVGSLRADAEHTEQLRFTGITWDLATVDLSQIAGGGDGPHGIARARHRFREHMPDFIWDAARLEGNTFTLPEVRTLLDGVTVHGKRLEDQEQILALNEGFNEVDLLVGSGTFRLSKEISDRLHGRIAVHEAIEAGHFRGEGVVSGGGSVRLASGGVVGGRVHGEGGEQLRGAYADLLDYLTGEPDPRVRALVYAASVIRHQLYFDGNKRTAKLMASGELMAHGFDAVSIPYSRLYEQNIALDRLFTTDDATDLMRLMADCAR